MLSNKRASLAVNFLPDQTEQRLASFLKFDNFIFSKPPFLAFVNTGVEYARLSESISSRQSIAANFILRQNKHSLGLGKTILSDVPHRQVGGFLFHLQLPLYSKIVWSYTISTGFASL